MPRPPHPDLLSSHHPSGHLTDETTDEATDRPWSGRVDWLVQRVFDPEGGGADYAYTIGLSRHGLPELHAWARPTLGDDPGADWMLSPKDQAVLLNGVAGQLLQSLVGPGSEWVESFDGGLTSARFRIGSPMPARRLDAIQLDGLTAVLPVRFSLHRPPEGTPAQLPHPAAVLVDGWTREVRSRTDQLRAGLAAIGMRAPTVPAPWRLPIGAALGDPVDVDPDQLFGPLHQLVAARAAQLVIADPHTLAEFVSRAQRATRVGSAAGTVRAVLLAHARAGGRQQAVGQAFSAAATVLDEVTGRGRATRRWREACTVLRAPPGGRGQRGFEAGCREEVQSWVEVTLATEALVDLLPDEHLAMGRGPWAWALHPDGAPGPAWVAPPDLVDRVVALFAQLSSDELVALVDRFEAGQRGLLAVAADHLLGYCTTGAGSPPAGTSLLPAESVQAIDPRDEFVCDQLARLLVAALAFRERLPADAWAAIADLVRPWPL